MADPHLETGGTFCHRVRVARKVPEFRAGCPKVQENAAHVPAIRMTQFPGSQPIGLSRNWRISFDGKASEKAPGTGLLAVGPRLPVVAANRTAPGTRGIGTTRSRKLVAAARTTTRHEEMSVDGPWAFVRAIYRTPCTCRKSRWNVVTQFQSIIDPSTVLAVPTWSRLFIYQSTRS